MRMAPEVRLMRPDERPAAWEMIRIAFGADREVPPWWRDDRPGRLDWAVFDESGRMIAKATDRIQSHWFGGRLVPGCGIAGVIVAPELRGRGLARLVLTHLLHEARARGATVATLFRTSPGAYRRLGCEEVGVRTWTEVPAAALATVRRPDGVEVRAATAEDVPATQELFRAMARASNGIMERAAPLQDTSPDAVLESVDGISVAVGADGVDGYASWDREGGYEGGGRIRVFDLVGANADATSALLAMLGTWASVAPTIVVRLPDGDPATLLTSLTGTRVEAREPWMLRVIDAAAAVAARGWPPHLSGAVDLLIEDETCPWNAGPHRLVVERGEGRLEPGGSGAVRLSIRGLAVVYAGACSPAVLRRAGLLDGGDERSDAFLGAASGGPPPTLLDYF
jgi:predicted acetyltransferase